MTTPSLEPDSWYWITYPIITDNVRRQRTLLRQCRAVRPDGFGLFDEVLFDGWGRWKDESIWVDAANCVAGSAPAIKKGFWASLFS